MNRRVGVKLTKESYLVTRAGFQPLPPARGPPSS